ncbi:hypothetical protein [Leptospira neocaledonica]|uniref:hypothetical protein n=1 Tax=Leptospira neocaledonica TaxID=2023192 RepID=UPI001FCAC296|nr:hypothetical protein [Leptospira neocaledonica]
MAGALFNAGEISQNVHQATEAEKKSLEEIRNFLDRIQNSNTVIATQAIEAADQARKCEKLSDSLQKQVQEFKA